MLVCLFCMDLFGWWYENFVKLPKLFLEPFTAGVIEIVNMRLHFWIVGLLCAFFVKLLLIASFILCWLFVAVLTPLLFSFHLYYYYYYYNCMFVFICWTFFVLFFCLFDLVSWMFMYLVGVPSTYLSNILFTIKRKTWLLILLLLWYIYSCISYW